MIKINPNDIRDDEWISSKERFNPPEEKREPAIDKVISEIVGKPIRVSDPRLLKLVVKYKQQRGKDDKSPDNFLENPEFIKELKETLI